ncbi:MAG: single-stranded DNA-binding protein [Clostridia bacterium]|nr:single-stranded DNA-binding protein [Clostridia bacterium]
MLNKVILMGRITRDIELKYTQSNTAVCSFSVAVERNFARQGEERQTDFINVVAWRQQAEFVSKYFGKGRMINVVGSLQTRTWDDQNGQKHYATEVIAEEINFCGEPKQDGSGARPAQNFQPQPNFGVSQSEPSGFQPIDIDDDLPF